MGDVGSTGDVTQPDKIIVTTSEARRCRRRAGSLLRGRPNIGGLDLGGAEFEFGDFAEGVELRVGQDVGGGLGIAEWDEHLARGDGAVGARLQFNRSAPCGDPDMLAGGGPDRAR